MKDYCFVYQPELKIGNKYLPFSLVEPIKQNIIPLYLKLTIFIDALKKVNEIDKNKKDLCSKLIEIFYEDNEKENTDRLNDLKKHVKSFTGIYDKDSDILEENNYNPTHFYGILFFYLYYYDIRG